MGRLEPVGPAIIGSRGVDERAIYRKLMRRILPFLFVCYVVSYLDRVNVGFAALTMNHDIGLSATAFGIGAGLFFFGYFVAEIPSNLIMMRVGARLWIARIMITWGLVSAATAFVTGPIQFGVARFLLGLGEAGFVPGVFLYLGLWFPSAVRARATALFLLGIPVANIFGSPISGALIQLEGFGLKGWQWLLILEAAPAILLGVACLFVLTDRPEKAGWLSAPERDFLVDRLAAERAAIEKKHGLTLGQALRNWRVLTLAVVNFCTIIGSLGIGLWLPQIIKQLGVSTTLLGFVTAIPYLCGATAMVLWGRMSDRGSDRTIYPAIALFVGAVALVTSAFTPTPILTIAALCVPSPNGIVIDDAMANLFVAVTRAQQIWRVPLNGSGLVAKVGVFSQLHGGLGGPDGIALDAQSCLIVAHTGFGSIWRLSPVAEPILRVTSPAGISTTNVAYGGPDGATLFITESQTGTILTARMPAPGQTLFSHR